jgi:hypothetical protein
MNAEPSIKPDRSRAPKEARETKLTVNHSQFNNTRLGAAKKAMATEQLF